MDPPLPRPKDGLGPCRGCDWRADSLSLDSRSHRKRTEVKSKERQPIVLGFTLVPHWEDF